MPSEKKSFDFWYAVHNTQIVHVPSRALETFGVKALAKAMKKALRVETEFISRPDIPNLQPPRLP